MSDLDERIRRAIEPIEDRSADDRCWASISTRLERPVRPAAKRGVRKRLVVAIMATVLGISGVAIAAQPELLERLFPAGSDADRMSGIQRPQTAAETAERDSEANRAIALILSGGPVQVDGHRVLLQHRSGPVSATLHAFPESNGNVCYFWEGTFGNGSCGGPALVETSIITASPRYFGVENEWSSVEAITGLATDAVSSVQIVMSDGSREPAIMGENSFLWYPTPYLNLKSYVTANGGKSAPPPDRPEPIAVLARGSLGVERVDIAPK